MEVKDWAPYLDHPMVFAAFCLFLLVLVIIRLRSKGKHAKHMASIAIVTCGVLVIFAGLAFAYATISRPPAETAKSAGKKKANGAAETVEVLQVNHGDNGNNVSNSGSGSQFNVFGAGK